MRTKLFHRDFGGEGKRPLVILHGLLGSSRNWMQVGRDLSGEFHVFGLDLRNHGQSPHVAGFSYREMAEDVAGWLDDSGIEKAVLVGHSMGGKTAMRMAVDHPERVEALVVVDISPRAKEPDYAESVAALSELPLEKLSSRTEADQVLAKRVPSELTRQFLLTNLNRSSDGSWSWVADVPNLSKNIGETGKAPLQEGELFEGPALWIAGGKSSYVPPGDHELIFRHFPNSTIEVFSGSGHNPHVDERERLVRSLLDFLK